MGRYKIFRVYDGAKVFMEGTAKEIAATLDISVSGLYHYVSEKRPVAGYHIVSLNEYTRKVALNPEMEEKAKDKKEIRIRKKKQDKESEMPDFDLLELVLFKRRHDFCSINSNPKDMIPKLKKQFGLECVYHENHHDIGVTQKKRKMETTYTVEVKRRGVFD